MDMFSTLKDKLDKKSKRKKKDFQVSVTMVGHSQTGEREEDLENPEEVCDGVLRDQEDKI